MRAFLAIPVDDALRAELAAAGERLRAAGAFARWVAPENLHLTLKFLGEIPESAAPEVLERTRALTAGVSPWVLEIRGIVPFPSARRPRVVAAAVADPPAPLVSLAQALDERFEDLGVPAEHRPFRAHFTLARLKGPRDQRGVLGAIGREAAERPGALGRLPVEEIVLLQSVLGPGGPRYTRLGAARLGDAT